MVFSRQIKKFMLVSFTIGALATTLPNKAKIGDLTIALGSLALTAVGLYNLGLQAYNVYYNINDAQTPPVEGPAQLAKNINN